MPVRNDDNESELWEILSDRGVRLRWNSGPLLDLGVACPEKKCIAYPLSRNFEVERSTVLLLRKVRGKNLDHEGSELASV